MVLWLSKRNKCVDDNRKHLLSPPTRFIRINAGLPDTAVLVTMSADNVRFRRQLCDKYNVTVRCYDFHTIELFSILYTCKAEVINNKGEIVAEASFTFTEATNHCEIVGRQ